MRSRIGVISTAVETGLGIAQAFSAATTVKGMAPANRPEICQERRSRRARSARLPIRRVFHIERNRVNDRHASSCRADRMAFSGTLPIFSAGGDHCATRDLPVVDEELSGQPDDNQTRLRHCAARSRLDHAPCSRGELPARAQTRLGSTRRPRRPARSTASSDNHPQKSFEALEGPPVIRVPQSILWIGPGDRRSGRAKSSSQHA